MRLGVMLCLRNMDACHILLARPWKFDKEANEGKIPIKILRMINNLHS